MDKVYDVGEDIENVFFWIVILIIVGLIGIVNLYGLYKLKERGRIWN